MQTQLCHTAYRRLSHPLTKAAQYAKCKEDEWPEWVHLVLFFWLDLQINYAKKNKYLKGNLSLDFQLLNHHVIMLLGNSFLNMSLSKVSILALSIKQTYNTACTVCKLAEKSHVGGPSLLRSHIALACLTFNRKGYVNTTQLQLHSETCGVHR